MPSKRISLELPEDLVDRLDQLRVEWHVRSRGACLERLLEEIFESEPEVTNDEPQNDDLLTSSDAAELKRSDPVYDEDRAIVWSIAAGVHPLCSCRILPMTLQLRHPGQADPQGAESIFQDLSGSGPLRFDSASMPRKQLSMRQLCLRSAKASSGHGLIQHCSTGKTSTGLHPVKR